MYLLRIFLYMQVIRKAVTQIKGCKITFWFVLLDVYLLGDPTFTILIQEAGSLSQKEFFKILCNSTYSSFAHHPEQFHRVQGNYP